MDPLSNRPLLLACLVIAALQLAVIYAAPLQPIFGTVPLTAPQLGLTVVAALVILVAGEIEKAIRRRNR
jgi:Ca2+-transporting ATPase